MKLVLTERIAGWRRVEPAVARGFTDAGHAFAPMERETARICAAMEALSSATMPDLHLP